MTPHTTRQQPNATSRQQTRSDQRPATRKQLAYLRALANSTGQTFAYPRTARAASLEIDRLLNAPPSSPTEIRVERKQIADAIATGPADSSRVTDDEIVGYGSSATWAHGRPGQPTRPAPPAGPTEPTRSTAPVVGSRTELGRYTLPDGEQRVLYGQRVNGTVRVSDVSQTRGKRAYLVERGLEQDGRSALNALIVDYLAEAQRLGRVPMAATVLDPS
jgi:hypothetical protein